VFVYEFNINVCRLTHRNIWGIKKIGVIQALETIGCIESVVLEKKMPLQKIPKGIRCDFLLGGRVELWQPQEGYRVNLDTIFLGSCVEVAPGQRVLDVGCGVGGIGLCLMARCPEITVVGIDKVLVHVQLAHRNFSYNFCSFSKGLITPERHWHIPATEEELGKSKDFCWYQGSLENKNSWLLGCKDLRSFCQEKPGNFPSTWDFFLKGPEHGQKNQIGQEKDSIFLGSRGGFDHVVTNPPFYHEESFLPPKVPLKKVSFMMDFSLDTWMDHCWHWVGSGGNLYFILPARQLEALEFFKNPPGPMSIVPLVGKKDRNPKRLLVRMTKESSFDGKIPRRYNPPFIVHEENGSYTQESKEILGHGRGFEW
jgi:tRNA1(Val) A37 N6-methylase TrmN6